MRKFLTKTNRRKIHNFLKDYLLKVLSEEESITDFRKAFEEAERVELYGTRKALTPSLVKDWLQGMPLCVAYMTHNIVGICMLAVTGSRDYNRIYDFATTDSEVDSFYWEEMGRIIFEEGRK